jgi:glutaminase
VQKGDPADELYLLVHGEVSVLVDAPDGAMRRIATMGIGTCFVEPAMLVDGGPRTAWVRADTPAVCWTMHRDVFQALGAFQPSVKIRLLENLMRSTARILSRSAGESSFVD